MCGRFALATPGETVAETFALGAEVQRVLAENPLSPRYNIAPTQPVLAVRLDPKSGDRELTVFQWGLIPSWSKDAKIGSRLINARSETVAEKPSFRAAFKRRRCLVPASGFYEWQKMNGRKQPVFIHPTEAELFALAGLWETWQSGDGSVVDSCTILTTQPNELVAPIHNRMPVILAAADFSMWLDPGERPSDSLHLLRPFPAEKMGAYPVSTWVNNPRHDDSQCIEPLEA